MFNNLELNVLAQLPSTMRTKLTLLKKKKKEVMLVFKNIVHKKIFKIFFCVWLAGKASIVPHGWQTSALC